MSRERPKWWLIDGDNMPKTPYTNISVPVELRREVEKLFKELEEREIGLAYVSFSDFSRDAIRRRIEEIRKTYLIEDKKGKK